MSPFPKKNFLLLCTFFISTALSYPLHGGSKKTDPEYFEMKGPQLSEIRRFQNIPMADDLGIVVNTWLQDVPGIKDKYNPSIVKTSDGYLIAFRHDLPWDRVSKPQAEIGLVSVDSHFQPIGRPVILNTPDKHAEDPRMFIHDNQLYIAYIHLSTWAHDYLCNIAMSQIDPSTKQVTKSWELLYKTGPREKNWVPFSYTKEDDTEDLYFVYEYNPFKLIRAKKPFTGNMEVPFPVSTSKKLAAWEEKWGKIRGGTPAVRLENGDYLAFFHSSFREKLSLWYTVGAITFEGKPPFRLKTISKWPLLFKNIYSSHMAWRYNHALRVLFPSGFVQDTLNGKDVFHLICGENDTTIRVVTIDQQKLFEHMDPITE